MCFVLPTCLIHKFSFAASPSGCRIPSIVCGWCMSSHAGRMPCTSGWSYNGIIAMCSQTMSQPGQPQKQASSSFPCRCLQLLHPAYCPIPHCLIAISAFLTLLLLMPAHDECLLLAG